LDLGGCIHKMLGSRALALLLRTRLKPLYLVVPSSFAGKRELGFKRGLTYADVVLFADMV